MLLFFYSLKCDLAEYLAFRKSLDFNKPVKLAKALEHAQILSLSPSQFNIFLAVKSEF